MDSRRRQDAGTGSRKLGEVLFSAGGLFKGVALVNLMGEG